MSKKENKNILVINGHPSQKSLCRLLADSYVKGAKENGFTVNSINLSKLSFDLNLTSGYKTKQVLEEDIVKAQTLIKNSDHIVFVYPNWWSGMPALLKGFIDRTFLPGFAFKYKSNSPFPEQLLKGRTARIIVTMDSPVWYFKFFRGSPGLSSLRKGVLDYCGISPVSETLVGTVRRITPERTQKTIQNVFKLGYNGL